jgi:hypothetical protein
MRNGVARLKIGVEYILRSELRGNREIRGDGGVSQTLKGGGRLAVPLQWPHTHPQAPFMYLFEQHMCLLTVWPLTGTSWQSELFFLPSIYSTASHPHSPRHLLCTFSNTVCVCSPYWPLTGMPWQVSYFFYFYLACSLTVTPRHAHCTCSITIHTCLLDWPLTGMSWQSK